MLRDSSMTAHSSVPALLSLSHSSSGVTCSFSKNILGPGPQRLGDLTKRVLSHEATKYLSWRLSKASSPIDKWKWFQEATLICSDSRRSGIGSEMSSSDLLVYLMNRYLSPCQLYSDPQMLQKPALKEWPWNPTFAIGAQDSLSYPFFLIVAEYSLFFEIC